MRVVASHEPQVEVKAEGEAREGLREAAPSGCAVDSGGGAGVVAVDVAEHVGA
jgi:hypothetical protein